MAMKYKTDSNELIEFRKKFWANVQEKLKKTGKPIAQFIKEADFENPSDLKFLENGKVDFVFARVYKSAKSLGCKPSDLLLDIGE